MTKEGNYIADRENLNTKLEELKEMFNREKVPNFLLNIYEKLHNTVENDNDETNLNVLAYKNMGYLASGYDYLLMLKEQ